MQILDTQRQQWMQLDWPKLDLKPSQLQVFLLFRLSFRKNQACQINKLIRFTFIQLVLDLFKVYTVFKNLILKLLK